MKLSFKIYLNFHPSDFWQKFVGKFFKKSRPDEIKSSNIDGNQPNASGSQKDTTLIEKSSDEIRAWNSKINAAIATTAGGGQTGNLLKSTLAVLDKKPKSSQPHSDESEAKFDATFKKMNVLSEQNREKYETRDECEEKFERTMRDIEERSNKERKELDKQQEIIQNLAKKIEAMRTSN